MALETGLEDHFVQCCHRRRKRLWCVKLPPPLLDRVVLVRGGRIVFFEIKRPDGRGRFTKYQPSVIKKLKSWGFEVHVIASRKEAEEAAERLAASSA